MAFPVTLNGRTYTLTDFEGTNYVDGLPDAFEDFVTHAGDIYNSTSTTSNSIGTGSKTFTVEANKPYQAGTPLRIADAAAPSTNFLDTVVTSYSGTTLVVNSIGFGGSGTKTSWTVNIGGAKTIDGTLGLSQGGTGATDAAGARTNIDVYSKADADSRFLNVSGEASDVTITGDLTVDGSTLHVDGATDTVGIGATSALQGNRLNLVKSNLIADGPELVFKNMYEGAGDKQLGLISFGGYRDVAGQSTGFSSAIEAINESYPGTNGIMKFWVRGNAENSPQDPLNGQDVLTLHNTHGAIFNEGGVIGADFRVESDTSTHMLFLDAGNSRIGVNSAAPARKFSIVSTGEDHLSLGYSDASWYGLHRRNSDGALILGGNGGADIVFSSTGGATFNESSEDADFRIESNGNANMLFVDAGGDHVNVGTASDLGGILNVSGSVHPILHVQSSSDGTMARFVCDDSDANVGPVLELYRDSSSPANNDLIGAITFYGENSAGSKIEYAKMRTQMLDVSSGAEDARFVIQTRAGGAGRERLMMTDSETNFNDDGVDIDFRVESDGNSNMFIVDAGLDRVKIGGNSVSTGMVSIQKNVNEDTDIGNTPSLVLRNRSLASGSDNIGGGIFFDTFRDVQDPCITAGIWFNKQPSGSVANHADIIFGSSTQYGNNTDKPVERMRVEAGGDVRLGTGGTGPIGPAFYGGNTSTGNNGFAIWPEGDGSSVVKVLSGVSSTAGRIHFRFTNSNGTVGQITTSGSSTSYATSSDYRLKENVVELTGATTRLKQLEPKRFNFIADADTTVDGFLAHEVQTVVPEAITGTHNEVDDDGNPVYQGIDQSKLVPLLVATIKELEARITALESN